MRTRGAGPKKRWISPKWEGPDLSPHRTEQTAHENPVQLGTWAGSKGITTSSCLISSLSLFSLGPTLGLSSTIHFLIQLCYALKLLAELFLLLPKHSLHFPTFPSHPFILNLPLMSSSHSSHSITASLLNKNHQSHPYYQIQGPSLILHRANSGNYHLPIKILPYFNLPGLSALFLPIFLLLCFFHWHHLLHAWTETVFQEADNLGSLRSLMYKDW